MLICRVHCNGDNIIWCTRKGTDRHRRTDRPRMKAKEWETARENVGYSDVSASKNVFKRYATSKDYFVCSVCRIAHISTPFGRCQNWQNLGLTTKRRGLTIKGPLLDRGRTLFLGGRVIRFEGKQKPKTVAFLTKSCCPTIDPTRFVGGPPKTIFSSKVFDYA